MENGYITDTEYHNYLQMVLNSAELILTKRPDLRTEAHPLLVPILTLPSDYEELIQKRDYIIVEKDNAIAALQAEIAALKAEKR